MNMRVSVIVPIYNVALYIEKCATSLLRQTLKDIELIFVDDASPDQSIVILEKCCSKYPDMDGRIKILHHEVNKGLPAARNTGLSEASGDYIFHCDGDDWVELDALEKLYETAEINHADYVWCDWYLSYMHNEKEMPQPSYDSKEDMLRFGLLGGGMKFNVWNKLVKKSLYDNNAICFPSGHSMGEDMTMIMLGAKAERVAHCSSYLYHYVKTNTNAYTQSYTREKVDDIFFNSDRVINYLLENAYAKDQEINWFKLNVKFPLLIDLNPETKTIWTSKYPEANKESLSNPAISIRSKMLQYLASHNIWVLVKIYSTIFNFLLKQRFR